MFLKNPLKKKIRYLQVDQEANIESTLLFPPTLSALLELPFSPEEKENGDVDEDFCENIIISVIIFH